MQIKDIIKITIFAIIGFILTLLGGYVAAIFGMATLYINSAVSAILVGPVIFVMCRKVHKRGTFFLYYLITGIVYIFISFWPMVIICAITGLIAELLIGKEENYNYNKKIILPYIVAEAFYALHGVIFFKVLTEEGVLRLFPKMFTPEMVDTIGAFYASNFRIFMVLVIQVLASFIGVSFGIFIYNKFFSRTKTKSVLEK